MLRDRTKLRSPGLIERIEERVAALDLDLHGMTVVTEAATGAYACTATIAAMAGAERVYALARDTARHGSARDAASATLAVAADAGAAQAVEIVSQLEEDILSRCDILTNSGHLRPITASTIDLLPARAVIALMFEAWEFRGADLDLAACRRRGIPVAAVNERHPDVAVFPFLGPLCVHLLKTAGLGPEKKSIALLCNNPFAAFIESGLLRAGASVTVAWEPEPLYARRWDAIVLAGGPHMRRLGRSELAALARRSPAALIAQFWGELDRDAAEQAGLAVCPPIEPRPGHMGILLNTLGDDPILRLQAGGLRAAELVARKIPLHAGGVAELL